MYIKLEKAKNDNVMSKRILSNAIRQFEQDKKKNILYNC
jgi:hypothetical protein